MNQLQNQYLEYAFLATSRDGAKREFEARVAPLMVTRLKRTYENPYKWYLVVFNPFNDSYKRSYDYYQVKGLECCRQYFKKPQVLICTRELESDTVAKTHINALVCTDLPPEDLKVWRNKYKMNVQILPELSDRLTALSYILKDSKIRNPYMLYLDYYLNKDKMEGS